VYSFEGSILLCNAFLKGSIKQKHIETHATCITTMCVRVGFPVVVGFGFWACLGGCGVWLGGLSVSGELDLRALYHLT